MKAATLDPRLEQFFATKVHRSPTEVGLALDPATAHHLLNEINQRTSELIQAGLQTVIVVGAEIRLPLKRFIEPSLPRLTVLAYQELPSTTEIENVGLVSLPQHLARQPELKAA
jgi:flagellar biosynthesis protein FlhA